MDTPGKAGATDEATVRMPDIRRTPAELGIIAWVSEGELQTPIQATGGFLAGQRELVATTSREWQKIETPVESVTLGSE